MQHVLATCFNTRNERLNMIKRNADISDEHKLRDK